MASLKSIAAGRSDVFSVDPEDLTLVTDPASPIYDERVHLPVEADFLASIMEHGVKEAVKVKRNGDRWEVVNGRQRVKAARKANKIFEAAGKEKMFVPTTLEQADEKQAMKLMVALNEHRRDDDPITKANKARRMRDKQIPEKEVAAQFGLKVGQLRELMKVLDTTPKVQKLVANGELSVQTAAGISDLPREEQDAKIEELKATVGLNRTTVAATVKARKVAKETGNDVAITVAPKRALVLALADDLTKNAPGIAALLYWVLTGKGAEQAVGPDGRPLTKWLEAPPKRAKKAE
jgi:ParB family chromosome partitioning protein